MQKTLMFKLVRPTPRSRSRKTTIYDLNPDREPTSTEITRNPRRTVPCQMSTVARGKPTSAARRVYKDNFCPNTPFSNTFCGSKRSTISTKRRPSTTSATTTLHHRATNHPQPPRIKAHGSSKGWPVTSPQASSIRPPHRCRVRIHVLEIIAKLLLQGLRALCRSNFVSWILERY